MRAGADVLELGVPFSDPMADGPVIQRASERALAQGVGLDDVLAMVAAFRKRDATTPVVLMGYANPIEAMGDGEFVERATRGRRRRRDRRRLSAGGGARIRGARRRARTRADLPAVADDADPRAWRALADMARGYVYYVSLKGVTGAGHLDTAEVAARLAEIRRHVSLPVGVGFGIRDAASAQAIAAHADAVVIGSRIIEEIEARARRTRRRRAPAPWLATIRAAVDQVAKRAA